MDAKPHRLRALRIHDENMPPPALPTKTLHQRTKSVPAFSTLRSETQVPMQAPIAKKVLGNVNPNMRLQQKAKDDMLIGKKSDVVNKKAKMQPSKIETIANAAAHNAFAGATTTDVQVEIIAPMSRPALRPQISKSFTVSTVPSVAAALCPVTLQSQKLDGLPPIKKELKVLKDEDVPSTSDDSIPPVQEALLDVAAAVIVTNGPALRSEPQAVHIDTAVKDNAVQQPAKPTANLLVEQSTVPSVVADVINQEVQVSDQSYLPSSNLESEKEWTTFLERRAETVEQLKAQSLASLPPYAPVVEMPAQYYVAEEEYEYYDDGFTTARSFGLSAESTGAFTTILVPKATDKIKLEIEAAKKYVESVRTPEDIDDELWDTSMVAEYGDEIFEYMHKLEERMLPDPRYMDIQQEIQWSMRAVLVDWVVQVHQRFTLLPETLFLSINYIDRFLSNKVVSLGKLQLVGATALFIAAKFEEVNCPTLQEVIFMVDGGYTVDELLKAERFMLSMLQFDLGWPGPMSFLRRISKADDYDLETRTLAKYFLEVTVMDERFIGCTPSFLAAGAHCLARLMLRKGDWTVAHVAYSNYTYAQLRPLLLGITECCDNPRRHHLSVYEKYTDKRYKRASTFVEAEILKGFSLHPRMPPMCTSYGAALMPLTGFA